MQNYFLNPLGLLSILLLSACVSQPHSLVLQSDFGESDGAVSAMRGVAKSVSGQVEVYDLTHDIPPYNIWEASYRLAQTVPYWPEGTVFVSVVDPGVGTDRLSVVAKTLSGHFIVTPDNGTLTTWPKSRVSWLFVKSTRQSIVARIPARPTLSTAGMFTPLPGPGWLPV